MALYGIDVSKWQSNDIVDQAGDFAIMKATEGNGYVDPTCDVKYQRAKKLGLKLAHYHFARPDLGNSAEAEAEFFVKNTKNYFGESIPVLDWERSTGNVAWAKAWLDRVYALTGVRPMIYMSASVVTGNNWASVANANYGLWIAGYPAKYNVPNPPKPGPNELPYKTGAWAFAAMWQYTSSAGTLDRDIFYGSKGAWDKYAAVNGVVAAPNKGDETATVIPEPKPEEPKEPEDSKPQTPVSTDTGLTLSEWDDIIDKAKKTVDLVSDTAKKNHLAIPMSNKVYDILKIVVAVVLPVISTLYVGLANIWGFGFGEQVDKTIQLIIAAINALLGIAIVKSSSDYHKGDK